MGYYIFHLIEEEVSLQARYSPIPLGEMGGRRINNISLTKTQSTQRLFFIFSWHIFIFTKYNSLTILN